MLQKCLSQNCGPENHFCVLLAASNIQHFEDLASCFGPGFGELVLNPQLEHIVWQRFGSGTYILVMQVLSSLHYGFGTNYRGIWSHYPFGEKCFFPRFFIDIFIAFSLISSSLLLTRLRIDGLPWVVSTQRLTRHKVHFWGTKNGSENIRTHSRYPKVHGNMTNSPILREKCPTLRLSEHGPQFQGLNHHVSHFLGTLKYAQVPLRLHQNGPRDESWLPGDMGNGMIVNMDHMLMVLWYH